MTQARVDALRDGPAPPGRPGDTILVVDDEAAVRELMGRWLRAQGHQVVCVSSADEALAIAAAETPAIALCDIRMPGRDGLWLASRLRLDYPDTAVIMATGVNDVSAAVASLRHGVVDYLTKPFGRDRLRDAVVRALEWHRAARDLRHWREALERDSDARRTTLSHLVNQQPIESAAAVEAFIGRLALHYPEAVAHARRVAELAAAIADRLDVGTDGAQVLRFGALLHDLGKLALPEAILNKPAPLTPDEQAIVRRHPAVGAQLLAGHPFLAGAAAIVRSAHERPDGLGYPAGLAGEALPLAPQIVAVSDAYDTMTHPRIFRSVRTPADALLEIDRCSGTQFDPRVAGVLKQLGHR
jgi:putative nucleotidyltransferase with HDIG domain